MPAEVGRALMPPLLPPVHANDKARHHQSDGRAFDYSRGVEPRLSHSVSGVSDITLRLSPTLTKPAHVTLHTPLCILQL